MKQLKEKDGKKLILKIWHHLSRKRKIQLVMMIILMIINSFAEVISLTSIIPFLTLLSNPNAMMEMKYITNISLSFGIINRNDFLLFVTLIFITAAIFSGFIRIATLWLNGRLAAAIGADLSCKAYEKTLYQDYELHLQRNSSTLISTLNKDLDIVITQILNPILQALTSLFTTLGITITLFLINWYVALITSFSVIVIYLISILSNKSRLEKIGSKRVELQSKVVQNIQEGLGSIKDIILNASQPVYLNIFSKAVNPLRRIEAETIFLNYYPRLVIEPVGLGVIAILGYFLTRNNEIESTISTLGALSLGAMRLLPMFQRLYEGYCFFQNSKTSLSNLIFLMDQTVESKNDPLKEETKIFKKNIIFKDVCFNYSDESLNVISNLNLEIKKGERIGIVGKTGTGKSTAIDLMMGLIKPISGKIYIDNKDLHDKKINYLNRWKSLIVHVPQNIYLSDNTLAENIAFGLTPEEIDYEKIKLAANISQIDGFIKNLEKGYKTFVGENGIRLSGGQKQRIGIARALYKNINVLILDEATSALDNKTEEKIINAIYEMSREITIIMITHRITTLKNCDRIINLEKSKTNI